MKKTFLAALICGLAGCEPVTTGPAEPDTPTAGIRTAGTSPKLSAAQARANFSSVVSRVEPVAEAQCRAQAPNLNCDFKIVVINNPRLPPNAFQTVDASGQPVIGFTISLIRDARNTDELAFVMGHEAAHHIEGHLEQQRQSAIAGAILGGLGAQGLGLDVNAGQRLGGTIGARAYSKANELEADALGTVISRRAGYDPLRGAQFFTRIPDPGDRFLGSHPPNAARIETVRRVNARL